MTRFTGRMLLVGLLCGALLSGCRGETGEAEAPGDTLQSSTPASSRTLLREPAVAGGFYPADPAELRAMVRDMLAAAETVELPGRVLALMVPHAGYIYSGPVAAMAYAQLRGRSFDTVILIGPSHRVPVTGVALPESTRWRTPLGEVPVDTDICDALCDASRLFYRDELAHRYEHSLEVQLPFLQTVLEGFAIVPMVVQELSPEDCATVGATIARVAAGRSVLLIASSDMAHYPAYEDDNRVDSAMLDAIKTLDPSAVFAADHKLMSEGVPQLACTLCGLEAVATVMTAARELGADSVHVLKHANSGDVPAGDRSRCVGYGAVALCGPKRPADVSTQEAENTSSAEPGGELDSEQQAALLALARESIAAYLSGRPLPEPPDDPAFARKRAVFVTLHKHGRLRGCIGSLEATQPLGQAVISAALAAATEDPRFRPVTADELDDLHLEISVLSPLRRVTSPDEIIVGTHGVLVRQGWRSGVFLPQVAPEQGWNREEMLTHLCAEKAGLPPDAWKHGAELYVFTAQVFAEPE